MCGRRAALTPQPPLPERERGSRAHPDEESPREGEGQGVRGPELTLLMPCFPHPPGCTLPSIMIKSRRLRAGRIAWSSARHWKCRTAAMLSRVRISPCPPQFPATKMALLDVCTDNAGRTHVHCSEASPLPSHNRDVFDKTSCLVHLPQNDALEAV